MIILEPLMEFKTIIVSLRFSLCYSGKLSNENMSPDTVGIELMADSTDRIIKAVIIIIILTCYVIEQQSFGR